MRQIRGEGNSTQRWKAFWYLAFVRLQSYRCGRHTTTPFPRVSQPTVRTTVVSAPGIWKYLDEKSVKKFGTKNTLLWRRRESAVIHDITSDALALETVQSHRR